MTNVENINDVNDNNFQEKVIEKSKDKPVIVDFWADWCMPCKMLAPALESVAGSEDYKDKVELAKVNVDSAAESAEKYSVMSIPAVKLIKNGEIVDEFTGAMPESSIKEWLDKNLE